MAPNAYSAWVRANRRKLAGGGWGLDGGEPGRADPAGFERAALRLLICRLSTYRDVAESISHRMLDWAARQVPGVYADLAFFPPPADAALMRRDGVPWWLASGCKRGPREFDVVAVSLAVPQEAFNLPAALADSGLRVAGRARLDDPAQPLVILGGHAAGSVPFVHGDAGAAPGSGGLVDAVCFGDGIVWLREFLRRCLAAKAAGQSKRALLLDLARELTGTYVPSLYEHATRGDGAIEIRPLAVGIPLPVALRKDPPSAWLGGYDGAYIPFADEDREETLPLAFGCPYRCRFCQSGWVRGSVTETGAGLPAAALRLKAAMAASDLNLLASDACSVRGVADTVAALRELFPRVSIKSVALASLAHRAEAVRLLRGLDKREFTFGVEGISARLRRWLGKEAEPAVLLSAVSDLSAGGPRQVKLFFIATGLETDTDVAEFEDLLRAARAAAPRCRWVVSLMPLFHAPFTPLQFAPLRPVTPALARALESAARASGCEARWSATPDEIDLVNRLCRAGRPATRALVDLSLNAGVRYDNGFTREALDLAARAPFAPTVPATPTESSVLPWDDLVGGTPRAALWKSYRQAERSRAEAVGRAVGRAPTRHGTRYPLPAAVPVGAVGRFWVTLAPEDAPRPDATVARGCLRALLRRSADAARAYLGSPALIRPPGSWGLAMAEGRFRARPAAGADTAPTPASDPARLVYAVELPAEERGRTAVRSVLEAMRRRKAAFQTVRKGGVCWSVVGGSFRKRTGVVAIGEGAGPGGTPLLLRTGEAGDALGREAAEAMVGRVMAVYGACDRKCPACRAPLLARLRADGGRLPDPLCVDCLVRA